MIIIALAGKKHTGKNTIAKLIATQVAGKTVELAFADSLKQEVAKACSVTVPYIEEHKDNFRKILQGWGTDFRRNLFNKNYWIDKFDAELWKQDADVVVVDVAIDDVRDDVVQPRLRARRGLQHGGDCRLQPVGLSNPQLRHRARGASLPRIRRLRRALNLTGYLWHSQLTLSLV